MTYPQRHRGRRVHFRARGLSVRVARFFESCMWLVCAPVGGTSRFVASTGTIRWDQPVFGEYGLRSVEAACFRRVQAPVGGTRMIVVMWAPVGGTSEFMAICCHRHFGGSSNLKYICIPPGLLSRLIHYLCMYVYVVALVRAIAQIGGSNPAAGPLLGATRNDNTRSPSKLAITLFVFKHTKKLLLLDEAFIVLSYKHRRGPSTFK